MCNLMKREKMDHSKALLQSQRSKLFEGIGPEDLDEMLLCLSVTYKEYKKDEMVIWEGDTTKDIGVVLSGSARSIKIDRSGRLVIVTLLEPGSPIGILLAAGHGRKSPVSVQALEDLSVMFIPIENMMGLCPRLCPRHKRMIWNFLDGIAEKALVLHDRNDCLIKTTIREKVLAYLMQMSGKTGTRVFTTPLDRDAMAEYLNVDRSALSRELSWMKRDGLIDFHKNSFEIL